MVTVVAMLIVVIIIMISMFIIIMLISIIIIIIVISIIIVVMMVSCVVLIIPLGAEAWSSGPDSDPELGGTQTGSYQTGSYQTGSYQKGRFIPPKPFIKVHALYSEYVWGRFRHQFANPVFGNNPV